MRSPPLKMLKEKKESKHRARSPGYSSSELKDYLLISNLIMTHAVSGQKVSVCRHLVKRSRLAVCYIREIHEHNEA